MKKLIAVFALFLMLFVAGTARAGLIIQPLVGNIYQIQHHAPTGQSFTAEDPYVSVGFWIEDKPGAGAIFHLKSPLPWGGEGQGEGEYFEFWSLVSP